MSFFDTMLEDVETMAIIGHIRPDGDCIGLSGSVQLPGRTLS